MTQSVTSDQLHRELKDGRKALVLFSGEWCPDCTGFAPVWLAWTQKQGRKVRTFRLEVPRDGDEWDEWALDEIPTVALFEKGVERRKFSGCVSTEDLDSLAGD